MLARLPCEATLFLSFIENKDKKGGSNHPPFFLFLLAAAGERVKKVAARGSPPLVSLQRREVATQGEEGRLIL